jgi:hypothetical protein
MTESTLLEDGEGLSNANSKEDLLVHISVARAEVALAAHDKALTESQVKLLLVSWIYALV